jgi:hypothetical protein
VPVFYELSWRRAEWGRRNLSMSDSQSQLLEEQATDGQLSPKRWDAPVFPGGSIAAPIVRASFEEGKSTRTISAPSCRLVGGTVSMDSLNDSTARPTSCKSCARSATGRKPRRRTVSEENTLAKRLKSLLDEDKASIAARRVEDIGREIFGAETFVYAQEAEFLAICDLAKLKEFISKVEATRYDLDAEYYFATRALTGGSDEQT